MYLLKSRTSASMLCFWMPFKQQIRENKHDRDPDSQSGAAPDIWASSALSRNDVGRPLDFAGASLVGRSHRRVTDHRQRNKHQTPSAGTWRDICWCKPILAKKQKNNTKSLLQWASGSASWTSLSHKPFPQTSSGSGRTSFDLGRAPGSMNFSKL